MGTYSDYKNKYLGKAIDIDGAAGVQCVDTYKSYIQYLGYGLPGALGGSGYAKEIYLRRQENGILNWCIPIPKGEKQVGDILVYQISNYTPYSHVGILDGNLGNGFHNCFSQNQGIYGGAANVVTLPDSALYPIVFRPKCFTNDAPNIYDGFKSENGTFTLSVEVINVRSQPNTTSSVVAKYKKGQSVNYDSYRADANGYCWISYVSDTGQRRYMACGECNSKGQNVKAYGTFK